MKYLIITINMGAAYITSKGKKKRGKVPVLKLIKHYAMKTYGGADV
jgi:hypothetical protein